MAKKLLDQKYEAIMAHILDPEHSPLPEEQQVQLDRIMDAARLLDRHPDHAQIVCKLQYKYRITKKVAYEAIQMASELYKNEHQFDYAFWKAWQIRDLLDCIQDCKRLGKYKEWINAHKVLKAIIGEEPAEVDDARRAEKTNVFIQLNKNMNIPLDVVEHLKKSDLKKLSETVFQDIDETEAEDIMNS